MPSLRKNEPDDGLLSGAPADPWRGLIAALVMDGFRLARHGDQEAIDWLLEDGYLLIRAIEVWIPYQEFRDFVLGGCMRASKSGLKRT